MFNVSDKRENSLRIKYVLVIFLYLQLTEAETEIGATEGEAENVPSVSFVNDRRKRTAVSSFMVAGGCIPSS